MAKKPKQGDEPQEETQGVQEEQVPAPQEETPPPTEEGNEVQTPEDTGEEDSEDLPEEPSKQKEAFIKQRQIIAEYKKELEELKTERERILHEKSVLDEAKGVYPSGEVEYPEITPDTDYDQVASTVNIAYNRASQANQRLAELEQRLEDERLYREFPELNPENPDYKKPETKTFEKYLAGQYLLEATKIKGKRPDLVAVARRARTEYDELSSSQKERIASEAVEELRKSENASLEARGTSVHQPKAPDLSALREKAKRGDPDAIAEILKNTVLAEE